MALTRWDVNFIWDVSVWDGYPEPDISFEKGFKRIKFYRNAKKVNFDKPYKTTKFYKREKI